MELFVLIQLIIKWLLSFSTVKPITSARKLFVNWRLSFNTNDIIIRANYLKEHNIIRPT